MDAKVLGVILNAKASSVTLSPDNNGSSQASLLWGKMSSMMTTKNVVVFIVLVLA